MANVKNKYISIMYKFYLWNTDVLNLLQKVVYIEGCRQECDLGAKLVAA